MSKFRVIVASTNRKCKTFFDDKNGKGGLDAAVKYSDDYKKENGVNCNVIEFRQVYTTITAEEAEAEAKAHAETMARNPSANVL